MYALSRCEPAVHGQSMLTRRPTIDLLPKALDSRLRPEDIPGASRPAFMPRVGGGSDRGVSICSFQGCGTPPWGLRLARPGLSADYGLVVEGMTPEHQIRTLLTQGDTGKEEAQARQTLPPEPPLRGRVRFRAVIAIALRPPNLGFSLAARNQSEGGDDTIRPNPTRGSGFPFSRNSHTRRRARMRVHRPRGTAHVNRGRRGKSCQMGVHAGRPDFFGICHPVLSCLERAPNRNMRK